MNTVADDIELSSDDKPGARLAAVRIKKGYSTDYVAGKLHLRVRLIELLEADEYEHMPEPVFIKGYLRAYAKLLDVPAEPLLTTFKTLHTTERKLGEKTLWQSRQRNDSEGRISFIPLMA